MRQLTAIVMAGALGAGGAVLHADVKTEERARVTFSGGLGRMINMFGGRAAREGVVTTVAVKGDRKLSRTDDTGQIVDLAEEKVYDVNFRDRSYTVKTFDQIRAEFEAARKRAAEQAPQGGGAEPAPQASGEPQREVEIDFDLKESGERKSINGFDAREIVMTITAREKGKTLEQGGGVVITSNSWLAPKIAAMNEVADFERRYAEKLALPVMMNAQQMAAAMAMYPMMADAMRRMQAESVNMDGTPVQTTVTIDAVASAEQAAQQGAQAAEQPREAPRSIGGLAGALGGRLGRRIAGGGNNNDQPANATPGRATFMTMNNELLKVTTTPVDADVQLPAGFRQR
ncbi:MAG: hypothetical protein AB7K63_03825 [Vicinamibacterales bacterium]